MSQPRLLEYGIDDGRKERGFVVAFGACLAYCCGLAWLSFHELSGLEHDLWELRRAPANDAFVVFSYVNAFILYAMAAANLLALAGYGMGARGRSPRRLFLLYVAIQTALILLHWAEVIYRRTVGYLRYEFGGMTYILGVGESFVLMPIIHLVLALPLAALIFHPARRACLRGR